MNYQSLEHPAVTHCLITGYPPWISDMDEDGNEYDYFDDDEGEFC